MYTESSNDELPEKKENKKKINLQHIEFLLLSYYDNVINYTKTKKLNIKEKLSYKNICEIKTLSSCSHTKLTIHFILMCCQKFSNNRQK